MRIISSVVIALTVASLPALAQDQQAHQGFWIGFGVGGGANVSEGLDGDRLGGGAGYVRLGGTLSQTVLLGFEGIGWGRERADETLARGNGTVTLMFYPSSNGGVFLKGGVGGASLSRIDTDGTTTTTTTESGFGATAGLGFDVRLGDNLYLVPALDYLFQAFDADDDAVLGDIPSTNSILLFTLGLVWH